MALRLPLNQIFPIVSPLKHWFKPSSIEPGRDHTALVDAADELHYDLSCSMVVDNLQVANVAVLLHHLQKLNDDLGVWPDQNLAFSTLLGIDDVVQAISQHADSHHLHNGCNDNCGGLAWHLNRCRCPSHQGLLQYFLCSILYRSQSMYNISQICTYAMSVYKMSLQQSWEAAQCHRPSHREQSTRSCFCACDSRSTLVKQNFTCTQTTSNWQKKSKAQSWGSNGSFNCCSHFKHVLQNDLTGHLPKSSPTGLNTTAQLLQPFDRQLRHTGEPCLTRMKDGELMVKRLHWETSKKHKRVLCSIVKCQHPCRIQKFSMCKLALLDFRTVLSAHFLESIQIPLLHFQLFGRMTCHFHSRGRNNHPLPSIPYLDMDWSWHTVGASLTVQKQDGNPERNMEASLFPASYVDAFCCLFDLCKFQNSFKKKQQSSLSVPHFDFCLYCICSDVMHLCLCLWISKKNSGLPQLCRLGVWWRQPGENRSPAHGPEPPVRGCDQAKEHGFHSWGTRDSAPNLRQNACFAEWGWWGACILTNKKIGATCNLIKCFTIWHTPKYSL